MRRPWRMRSAEPLAVSSLAKRIDVSPLLARCLLHRGFDSAETASRHLRPSIEDLHDPFLLPDMDRAVERVVRALRARERILIHGDYDVDGMLGTALLLQFFRAAGSPAEFHIPDRVTGGYSFQEPAIERIAREGVRLVISVDNGTGAVGEIRRLQEAGVDVIVTDHHVPGPSEPPAFAVVNPCREGNRYPYPGLCGAGVAFKLAWAVAERFSPGRKRSADLQAFLLDALAHVAIATIADVAPLHGENRVLVRFGLAALRRTTNPGLRALLDSGGLEGRALRAEDVSFRIAPKLNAAGRLGRHEVALECLTTSSHEKAVECAKELEKLNSRRQRIDREIHREARERVASEVDLGREPVIVLASEGWHPGVVGIAASRLAEEFQRPVALVALAAGRGRGSMRTVPGAPLLRLLDACADLLESHGGHIYAAGFEVRPANLPELRRRLCEAARAAAPSETVLSIDAEVGLSALTPTLLDEFERLEPFGEGNESLVFAAREVEVLEPPRRGARGGGEWTLTLREGDAIWRAVARPHLLGVDEFSAGATVAVAYSPARSNLFGQAEVRVRDLCRAPEIAFVA